MDENKDIPDEREVAPVADSDAAPESSASKEEKRAKERDDEPEPRERFTLFRKDERKGKYISKLTVKELENAQLKKTLYMYLSTVFFAVNMFLKVEGRTRLSENTSLFALFSLYVICEVALLVYSVYIMIMGRFGHKIRSEIPEKVTPRDGLDKHTFRAYEVFNIFHLIMAAAELAVSVYKIGVYGVINIVAAVLSATFSFMSRQVLFRANSGNLEYIPPREEDEAPTPKRKRRKK